MSSSRSVSLRRGASAQLAVKIEQRAGIVSNQAELGDPFARGLLLLDLFGEEPLQLGHFGERLVREAQLIEVVDLFGHARFLPQCDLEHLAKRLEFPRRLIDGHQLDGTVTAEHEAEQLHTMPVLLDALW